MKKLTLAILLIVAAALPARAQVARTCSAGPVDANRHVAVKETTLSGAAEKITVQQASGNASKRVTFECIDVRCSVACEIFFYQNGAAATTTALTISDINLSPSSTAAAFSSSNGGGSTAYRAAYLESAGTVVFDATNVFLPAKAGGTANFSVGTASMTGTVRIQIQWIEN
ncbi:MAG TPA: hypothetical protein VNG71_04405 [Pyrinomonadaceae bacterium]|nr:hypothetical protein [Pyrinomonadaceae bacterium]